MRKRKGTGWPRLNLTHFQNKRTFKRCGAAASFGRFPGGFSRKGKHPSTEIALKPSDLGQFFFFFLSFFFFLCFFFKNSRPD
jgi:hypothetical protein